MFHLFFCIILKNPAYGTHQIFQPIQLIAPIYFFGIFEKRKSIRNNFMFLRLYELVHKCTSHTPLTHGPFTSAIWNNSLFLRLYESADECTSPLVEHLPRVADPCMQSRTTPHFQGSSESAEFLNVTVVLLCNSAKFC